MDDLDELKASPRAPGLTHDEIKALIREEVTRQLDEREEQGRKDLETAQALMDQVQQFRPFQIPRVGPSMLIDHDPKDAA